ncbi:fimbrial protein [Pseudomonas sp. B21-012]|uniref:fimbrial protein n=1 Tax=Pseudomonas sp. B21-012 TaxID=2895472 RepID=UPI00215DF76D|nr:fimbrial protein [Pseudomonas sp. B21-012]UVM58465.1 fimbrial protein [Pseudomonas sp. B21-012]
MSRLSVTLIGSFLLVSLTTATPAQCYAAQNMQFTGNFIVPPACTVSDKGRRLEVHFESVIAINNINGDQYRQAVPYQIDCPGAAESGVSYNMKLTLLGTPTQFDPAAIQSSLPDLGIKMLLGGTDLVLNEPRQIDISNTSTLPTLEAVPVKNSGAALDSGNFDASALLIAELY